MSKIAIRAVLAAVAAGATLLLGGCAVPSLGIRLGPVPAASGKVEVVDLRPEARKQLWRDPKFGRMANLTYIGDADTVPDRLALLQATLDGDAEFARRFRRVEVEVFDILWNTGATTGLDLQLAVGPDGLGVAPTSQSGMNHFTCTLRARVAETSYKRVARGEYFATDTQTASHPVIGGAARQCLNRAIAQWLEGALSGKDPVRSWDE